MKYFFLSVVVLTFSVIAIAGFRGQKSEGRPFEIFPDMDHQEKVKAQKDSKFFADGRGARTPVAGTISTKVPVENEYLYTGKINGQWGDGFPIPVDLATIKRGQERFTINCAVCHGPSGMGNGVTSKYGLVGIANLQGDLYRTMADGHIFNTITYGKGNMMGYGSNITPEDRWAIIAYLRVLQRSQGATVGEVPPDERTKLEQMP
jgi:mono/diheme cytochrome c family protein